MISWYTFEYPEWLIQLGLVTTGFSVFYILLGAAHGG